GGGSGFREERSRIVLDPPRGEVNETVVKTSKSNPFGAARPREEVLAEKGLDWKKLDSEIEAKKVTSRPTSSHSSRPSSAQSSRSEGPQLQGIENVLKPKPKVNPFGDAKPREVLLEERGQDWRKIDLELERRRMDRLSYSGYTVLSYELSFVAKTEVDVEQLKCHMMNSWLSRQLTVAEVVDVRAPPETEEEKILKEEIDNLKKELEKDSTPASESALDQSALRGTLLHKERELEKLIRDLENKVKIGQKAVERPGSGSGRIGGSYSDRPPSQSGSSDSSRNMEFMDRPRSRGTVDGWTRPADDRRGFQGGFQGGRDRGYPGNRDVDR
ncbi:hypothetical protein Godav_014063, partial [Gossypium davidsonii]|nr:hypothetical protein [Gossypium davidsonii]